MTISIDKIAIQFGSISIYWYGIFVTLGILASWFYLQGQASGFGFHKQYVSDLCFTAILGGIIGARIFYVLLNLDEFRDQWLEIIRIDHGGLVIFGGILGGALGVAWKSRQEHQSILKTFDFIALALPLGEAIGRFGCLINGCCFGRPTSSWFALHYPLESSVWHTQVYGGLIDFTSTQCLPVIPAQLLQSGLNLAIVIALYLLSRKKHAHGFLTAIYLVIYACGRFGVEFWRGDYYHLYAGLTQSQIICLLLLPLGIGLLIRSVKGLPDHSASVSS